MFNWLKSLFAPREIQDPWAKTEAEYDEYLRQHPEVEREVRLEAAKHALNSGMRRDLVEQIYPEIIELSSSDKSHYGFH